MPFSAKRGGDCDPGARACANCAAWSRDWSPRGIRCWCTSFRRGAAIWPARIATNSTISRSPWTPRKCFAGSTGWAKWARRSSPSAAANRCCIPSSMQIIARMRKNGILSGMITNGYLLTAERIERLNRAGLEYLQISIDNADARRSLEEEPEGSRPEIEAAGRPRRVSGEYQFRAGQRREKSGGRAAPWRAARRNWVSPARWAFCTTARDS